MIGPHVIESSAQATNFAQKAGIVKSLDNVAILQEARADAVKIFRHFFATQNLNDAMGTAQEIVSALNGYNSNNLYLELWNEVHPTLTQLKAVVDILHRWNYNVAGGSWGTGDYDASDFQIAQEAGCDAIAVHCYWDAGQLTIWEAYCYRSYWQLGMPPVVVTECGRRHGNNDPQELITYAQETSKDSYVGGVLPFTWGPTEDWDKQGFNNDGLSSVLIPYSLGVSPMVQPAPPNPSPVRPRWARLCDISNYQGTVNFDLLAPALDGVIVEARDGTTEINTFGPDWYQAGEHGLARVAYMLMRPSQGTGRQNAEWLLETLTTNGFNAGDNISLDFEEEINNPDGSPANLLAFAIDATQTIAGGLKGLLSIPYSSVGYLLAHQIINSPYLASCGIWLDDMQTAHTPTLPPGWNNWTIWQYAQGNLPGISGIVDLDLYNGTIDQLLARGYKP